MLRISLEVDKSATDEDVYGYFVGQFEPITEAFYLHEDVRPRGGEGGLCTGQNTRGL